MEWLKKLFRNKAVEREKELCKNLGIFYQAMIDDHAEEIQKRYKNPIQTYDDYLIERRINAHFAQIEQADIEECENLMVIP